MSTAPNGHTHHHGLGGMSWPVLAGVVAVFGCFAGVAYNMGRQAARIDQVERDVVRIDAVQKENNFRMTVLERKAAK